ncbi:hypothetical protein FRC09_010246 [Ceratobasidium sp. 395]|nr:hypothetical protein FRC09_010246 [Ceratobasidium sp. 395]
MRFQVVLSSLALAAVVTAQSSESGPGTTPIPITGPNMTPPPTTGIASDTSSTMETQSPRPSLPGTTSEAPTETMPSITGEPPSPSATSPASSVTGRMTTQGGSLSSVLSSIASSASSAAGSASSSPNAGVAVELGVAGWSVMAIMAGVLAGAALV